MISEDLLRQADRDLIKRYSDRLEKFGDDPRTLGWDIAESQKTRFQRSIEQLSFSRKSVLDIGCGLADFGVFLDEKIKPEIDSYFGVDINPSLIAYCRQKCPSHSFRVGNVLLDQFPPGKWDIVTMFGLLNFRFRDFSNEEYSRLLISEAFKLCKDAVVVDMLSSRRDDKYAEEKFVYYYSPEKLLEFALSLSPHVSLLHDYASIPQREFTIVIRKNSCV